MRTSIHTAEIIRREGGTLSESKIQQQLLEKTRRPRKISEIDATLAREETRTAGEKPFQTTSD